MEEIVPFADIVGKNVWQVNRGIGSFLTMEFGLPRLEIREPKPKNELRSEVSKKILTRRRITVLGEWHLWLQCTSWSMTFEDDPGVNGDSSPADIDNGIRSLDGQKLEMIALRDHATKFVMKFDLGALLKVFPNVETTNSVLLALYGPNDFYQEIVQSSAMELELNLNATSS